MDERYRDYEPIQPRGAFSLRSLLRRLWAPIAALAGAAIKFGAVAFKVVTLFVSVGAYALWFHSWKFAVGFVGLILVHELGHMVEAKRQGLKVSAPTFIPFFGAYVTIQHAGLPPLNSALIALAGPLFGGIGGVACWIGGTATDSHLLLTLANITFLINLFNLLPIGFLDGGAVARAAGEAWRMPVIRFEGGVPMQALRPNRGVSLLIWTLYLALAGALVLAMWRTQTRL